MAGDQDAAELQALVALPNLADAVPVQLWQQVVPLKPALVVASGPCSMCVPDETRR